MGEFIAEAFLVEHHSVKNDQFDDMFHSQNSQSKNPVGALSLMNCIPSATEFRGIKGSA